MGTSQSSSGPGSGVPLIPPWVPDVVPAEPPTGEPGADDKTSDTTGSDDNPPASPVTPQAIALAPAARFRAARRALGEYARAGDRSDMRRSLGHYVRTGYGGSGTAARRMGGTASTASTLLSALSNVAAGRPAEPGSPLDPALLAGRSVREVMDAVVEAVRPIDGTQDAEAARAAIRDALSELLTRFPDADILNLSTEQRTLAIECYAALDVFRRFDLDVGKTIHDNAPSAVTALARLKEVRDYVKEVVAASFRRLSDSGRAITAATVSGIVRDALRETFQVFQDFAE